MKFELKQLSREDTIILLAGIDHLHKSLKVGEKKWIDEYQFWIRLYEPEASFPIQFYKVDTRYRRPLIGDVIPLNELSGLPPPGGYSNLYLVFLDGWLFPRAGHVYCDPGRDQQNGNVFGFTIRFDHKVKDEFLHVPIEFQQAKNGVIDWCLGGIVDVLKSVRD